jgi:hypothetical protein
MSQKAIDTLRRLDNIEAELIQVTGRTPNLAEVASKVSCCFINWSLVSAVWGSCSEAEALTGRCLACCSW